MLKPKVQEAINAQINAELYSAYLYLAMSAWSNDQGLTGVAAWLKTQAQEEMTHAWRFFDYVHERGGTITLDAIKKPDAAWESPLVAFEAVLTHERYISGRIDDLVNLAVDERDHATSNFLQWFVSEQVEEEANVEELLGQLRLMGESGHGLYMMDRNLAARPALFALPAEK